MVAYNFQPHFVGPIRSGDKTQTIRARSKRRHAKPGEMLQLYTGMRCPGRCQKIIPDPVCTAVFPVEIDVMSSGLVIRVNGCALERSKAEEFAKADGFESAIVMAYWFERTRGLPFDGVCI